ncbi:quinon protein alcohol dehydrogenase-like superfamily [Lyophyllum atratum]|nr:quinon protein alcohol dehydrogenase-like superfamily [Lyophyllum atratum]
MFNGGAQGIEIGGGTFSVVMGDVHHYPPPGDELKRLNANGHKPDLPRLFKKSMVLRQDGFAADVAGFSHNGCRILAISSENPTVLTWDVNEPPTQTPACHHLKENGNSWTGFVGLSPSGSFVAVGPCSSYVSHPLLGQTIEDDGRLWLWDLEMKSVSQRSEPCGTSAMAVFSADGEKLATTSYGHLQLWDLQPGRGVIDRGYDISICAFSRDGERIVSVGSTEIIIWYTPDAETLEFESGLRADYTRIHNAIIRAVAFSPDGDHIALGFEDGKIIIMDAESGDVESKEDDFIGHEGWVTQIVFASDGEWMLSASRDGSIQVWDVARGQAISKPLKGHASAVTSIALSLDEKMIVAVSQGDAVVVWTLVE